MNIEEMQEGLVRKISEGFQVSTKQRTKFLSDCIGIFQRISPDESIYPEADEPYVCRILCIAGLLEEFPKGKSMEAFHYKLTVEGKKFYESMM
ncbi:MAG: hypothetical protein RL557_707 [archaeon]|jgi:hypothetical protein